MSRLSKTDWLEEGFKTLRAFNQNQLRVQYLCERLGVTRGSFYHHFESMEDYLRELLQEWRRRNTLELIEFANRQTEPLERLKNLNIKVNEADQTVEAAIRSWSFYHPMVRENLGEIDEIRLKYLEEIYKDMGLSEEKAALRAKLEYATLIGIELLFPQISAKDMEALHEDYMLCISNINTDPN